MEYDFGGWATRNDLLCADGRTIRQNAFKDNDGKEVPIVWNHQHNSVENVLGHAVLENREDGVYAYGVFNDTKQGQDAKKILKNGDISSLSIWANKLTERNGDVIHGDIKELSLVLAGANPGAYVDFVLKHDEDTASALQACYDENLVIYHSDTQKEEKKNDDGKNSESEKKDDKTIEEILGTMNEEQLNAVYAIVGTIAPDDEEGDDEKKKEKEIGQRLFREGDKVMQVKNNYQLEWEILGRYKIPVDKGVGVFNGDTGIMTEINEFAETATVEFEDGRQAEYSFKQLEELELAYAVTIHKSQGSEYPAVILPILSGPRMLMNRNLLYTAVTRARKCVTVVGSETTFAEMIRNEKQQQRYSSLDRRIRELDESEQKESAIGEKGLS